MAEVFALLTCARAEKTVTAYRTGCRKQAGIKSEPFCVRRYLRCTQVSGSLLGRGPAMYSYHIACPSPIQDCCIPSSPCAVFQSRTLMWVLRPSSLNGSILASPGSSAVQPPWRSECTNALPHEQFNIHHRVSSCADVARVLSCFCVVDCLLQCMSIRLSMRGE